MRELHGPFIMVDPERCVGCHTCELACAVAHTKTKNLFGAVLAKEPLNPRNRVVQVADVRFSTQCRQCEDAPCVKVCPTGATYRTDTYTAVNPNLCIGCRLCMMVCPFGAIHVGNAQVNGGTKIYAIKCDLCVDREGGPACIEACPTKALSIAYPEEVVEVAQQSTSERFLEALEGQQRVQEGI